MRVNDNDVKTMINEYYRDQHPELNITKRILDNLIPIVCKGLSETPDSMTIEKAMPAVHKFLEKENILNFIIERQPNMTCIPDQVVKSLKEYFVEDFKKNYTTSFFLLFMFIGWVLDLSMGTMPRYTLTGMVLGAVIGSCASVKKRNNEKEREERLNGKKYM